MTPIIHPTKICPKCGRELPVTVDYFYPRKKGSRDGFNHTCKECHDKMTRAYSKTERGRKARAKYDRKMNRTERRRKQKRRIHKRYYEREKKFHPEKIKARNRLTYEIVLGRMPKAKTLKCICGNQAEHYHHWHGYDEEHALDVIALCRWCHRRAEKEPIE